MPSQITIRTLRLPKRDGDFIRLTNSITYTPIFTTQTRLRNQYRAIQSTSDDSANRRLQAQRVIDAFNRDYNIQIPGRDRLYEVRLEENSNDIIIIAPGEPGFFDNAVVGKPDDEPFFPFEIFIINTPAQVPLSVEDILYVRGSEASCDTVDVRFDLSKSITGYVLNNGSFVDASGRTEFIPEVPRGTSNRITFFSGSEEIISAFTTPGNPVIEDIRVLRSLDGFDATIVLNERQLRTHLNFFLDLQYSVDGVTFQNSPVFSGLETGTYTVTVRDNGGCEVTQEFTVAGNESNLLNVDSYFRYPIVNSIYLALRNELPKNPDNTLSYEADASIIHPYTHCFTDDKTIRLKFESNLKNHDAKLIDCEGNERNLPIVKRTNNVGNFDLRDAKPIAASNRTLLAFYFDGGNIYDPNTNEVIATNEFVKTKPDFINIGSEVRIGSFGFFEVTSIYFDERVQSIAFETNFSAGRPLILQLEKQGSFQLGIFYNIKNYDIYEMEVDPGTLEVEKTYQLSLDVSGDEMNLSHLSEKIAFFKEIPEKHYQIFASHSSNQNFDYTDGVRHIANIPYYDKMIRNTGVSVDTVRNNNRHIHLRGETEPTYTFHFDRIPENVLSQIEAWVILDEFFINGIGYTDPELESEPVGETNLFDLELTVKRSGNQFSIDGSTEFPRTITEAEFLITSDSEFIKTN